MKFIALFIIITFFSISGYSQTAPNDSVLVRLSTLNASKAGNGAKLMWNVVCFLEFAKFEIQRSANGQSYTTINTFTADRLRCRQPFEFTDANVSGTAFYRIRVGDLDGRYSNSKVVAVTANEKDFEINALTPSLVTNGTLLSISSGIIDKAEVTVTNLQGAVVKRFITNLNKGVTEVSINFNNTAKGNYVLAVKNSFSKVKTIRFVKL